MSILEKRLAYRPFKYTEAYNFFLKQQQAHWVWTEVQMGPDITDFRENLTDV